MYNKFIDSKTGNNIVGLDIGFIMVLVRGCTGFTPSQYYQTRYSLYADHISRSLVVTHRRGEKGPYIDLM